MANKDGKRQERGRPAPAHSAFVPGRTRAGITIASSLSFRSISHAYGDNETLKDLDLAVEAGEVLSLLGPSGSGKTTLLRLAAGLVKPAAGEILINQQVVSSPDGMVPPERRGVGLVFQDYALFPHLSVRKNVEFGLTQLAPAERESHVMHLLKTVGLEARADDHPHNLSGGEQQRVALARALGPKPGILLMDEPFSGLDGRLRESVRNETLAILRETRSTVVVVTHDPEEAMHISDRIALMDKGRIVQVGKCETLYRSPESLFAARFFSELNTFAGNVAGGVLQTLLGDYPLEGTGKNLRADGPVTVCVRPSDIAVLPRSVKKGRRKEDTASGMAEAVVIGRHFLGESELVTLYVPQGEITLQAKLPFGALGSGQDRVRIGFDAAKALLFSE
ncbi:ABC transporter ATP-binding protein [Salaquimonas pukyongi]|uniref:ABC transporter ATP-binding protein n=1 Tax=Salaquimonas pukyongi TaxID=2712698 RepID=UPI0013BE92CC|nr:ABC transporter ATP-binding protein [Salaquimonas pukyongi]